MILDIEITGSTQQSREFVQVSFAPFGPRDRRSFEFTNGTLGLYDDSGRWLIFDIAEASPRDGHGHCTLYKFKSKYEGMGRPMPQG